MLGEWTPIDSQDARTTPLVHSKPDEPQIIDLVFQYQEQLRHLVLVYLDRNVFLEEFDMTGDIRTIPWKELFNAIETNLNHLVATDFVPGMEFTKIWRGGVEDSKFLDYTDVNRWFATIQLLYRFIQSLQVRYYETNAFYLGMNPDHQIIGIPQPPVWQRATRLRDAGQVLIGGRLAGTWGDSLDIDTMPTMGSNSLITSDSVYQALVNAGVFD